MVKFAQLPKYEAYKDSGVEWLGDVPVSWELTRLGTQFSERRTKVSDVDYPPLSVTRNGILPQLESAAKTKDGDNRKLVKAGDFVINSRSDRKGSSGVSNSDGSVSLISIVLEPRNIHPKFCHHLLKSYAFIEEYYRVGRGIVADLWTTRYNEMRTIILAVPTYDEQFLIANFLDQKTAQIDAAIAIKEQQIELLKERKQIIIQQAVTQGLDPNVPMKDSGVEWIGQIPEHWEVVKLSYVAKIDAGSTPSRSNSSYWGGNIPWIKTGEVNYNTIFGSEECITTAGLKGSSLRLAPIGTLLMAMYGQGVTRGRVSVLGIPATYNQACCGITFKSRINVEFARFFFIAAYNYIRDDGNETSQMNLSAGYISSLRIVVPSLDEQSIIIKFLDDFSLSVDEAVSLQVKQIQKLKEYKTTLINSAVTGKIKITPEMLQA
ncbi:hypothetical protein AKN88_01670 [Thiopseudomonas alkaliphila]|uniref:Type I restriction modification DNA specificity domain-containing protein n=1 Tax=Thiopseudomonas alkaliphila TaxID=1697053 RepID=A0A0K1XC67_9GAMM|nr:restriction endonuclease subunit S [Thiopseudomonas alkaliphila]AKX58778.1 hypothetical protein AKN88_01670 [Thiopseudomonas alkaliphila]